MATLEAGASDPREKTLAQHILSENLHDVDGVMQTYGEAPRYDDEPLDEHHLGRERVRAFYESLLRALPDLAIDVKVRYATGDAIIQEVEVRGTHTGPWRGLPGTGRRLRFPLCAVYTFDQQGKIAGERIYYDRATLLRQVGLFHEPTTPLGRLVAVATHPLTFARAWWRWARRR